MTRVIHVITASRIAGGMEAFLARLAPALGRFDRFKGFDVALCAPDV